MGFTNVQGKETGNAASLSQLILKTTDEADRILFLCGDKRREDIPLLLREQGLKVDELTVYETKVIGNLKIVSISSETPTWIVHFSPSLAKRFVEIYPSFAEFKHAAIGETTRSALEELGVHVHAVAMAPNAKSLLQAISSVALSH